MMMMMMMMMNWFCGMIDRREIFSLISSRGHCQRSSPSRIVTGVWTHAEHKFRLSWMKLCSSRNHYTTAPHSFKYSGICFIIFNATIVLQLATHIKTRNGCQRRKCYQEGAESCLSHIHIFRNGISLSNRSFIAQYNFQ